MLIRRFSPLLVCALWCCALVVGAQETPLPRFNWLLEKTGIDYLSPVDAGYREINTAKNDFQSCDYAIYSRKEDLEIRFLIRPVQDTLALENPHIRSMGMAMHVATNEDPSPIAVHYLKEAPYHADWGEAFFFRPKPVFGNWQHCKMLALYKEGRGMFFVFYFFNEADKALDNREVLLQFSQ